MKFKTIVSAIALAMSASAMADEVSYARVTSVIPIQENFTSYEVVPVCGIVSVPVTRQVPVYTEQTISRGDPVLGALVGAAIGSQLFRGDAGSRVAGGFLGAAIGSSFAEGSTRRIVEYRTEVHYEQQRVCRERSELVTRVISSGYQVTYEFKGVRQQTRMNTHPGEFVRIVTTQRIEP